MSRLVGRHTGAHGNVGHSGKFATIPEYYLLVNGSSHRDIGLIRKWDRDKINHNSHVTLHVLGLVIVHNRNKRMMAACHALPYSGFIKLFFG
jgi:hypothetical protein